MKEKNFSRWCEPDEHNCFGCELSRAKQVVALARRSRWDFQSGLARVLSLVRIDVNCECYYLGVIGVFLLFFFFGFSFLVQRPLSCSPTATRHFASLGQQGAARRGAFLCA
jgi:hypothetical protein